MYIRRRTSYNVFTSIDDVHQQEITMAIGSKWLGQRPVRCGLCGSHIHHTFVDGRTANGQWAVMCPTCRVEQGRTQLGVGLGQKYELRGGDYVRTV